MATQAHLWAVGYETPDGAAEVLKQVTPLAGPEGRLILVDTAVVVRHADGSFTLDGKPFSVASNVSGRATRQTESVDLVCTGGRKSSG